MKNILICVLCSLASLGAIAETVSAASQSELTNAITAANAAKGDIEIKLSGSIVAFNGYCLIQNPNVGAKITFTGPAEVKGRLVISSMNKAAVFVSKVVFSDISDPGGTVTILTDDSSGEFENLIILPSSQRQVYFGFEALSEVASIAVEKSSDGKDWTTIEAKDLIHRDASSAEPTQVGWESIRYTGATPGETAFYKLVATTEKGTTFESAAVQVTTAAKGSLHSRPGAKATIYLDFDGYVDDYAANASAARRNYIQTPVFENRSAISNVWRSVAEDFSIFDVDVTTEEPPLDRLVKSDATDDEYGKRVVFDKRTGLDKWYVGAGGMSGAGAFGFRTDRPAFIFDDKTDNIACQATHEVSHTLGLVHDGGVILIPAGSELYENGVWTKYEEDDYISSEYFSGQRVSLNCTWYPVMGGVPTSDGADYINQFSNGNYETATNTEDDFAVITGKETGAREENVVVFPAALYPEGTETGFWKLNLLADDVGNEIVGATAYAGAFTGLISPDDVDVFSFKAGKGKATIKVSPEYQGSSYGSSLDAKVELLDAKGNVLKDSIDPLQGNQDDGEFRRAELEYEIAAEGTYYVRVSGTFHETRASMTTAYGSVGPYVLTIEASEAAGTGSETSGGSAATTVEPFMAEHWNQTSPWNDYMPSYLPADEHADTGMESYNYRAPAGCVATAMAQVLDYWQWPKRYLTIPKHRNDHSVGVESKYAFTLSMNFDGHTEFKFDGSDADMARLTYMCASLGNLAFNRSGTGGVPSVVAENLSDYYEYESGASWDRVKELLSKGYPIPATITGHAIVLHGWKLDEKGNDFYYKNNGYGGSGDGWISRNEIKTTTVCYPKKKAFFEPMQKVYGSKPTISWTFPKRYETLNAETFGGFRLSVYGKGEETPFKTYDVAATVRSFVFTELAAGSYTIEIAPIFGGKVLADQADSKPLVITDSVVTPLTMELSSKVVTTDFKPISFTATCSPAVKEVSVFPNITEFRQEATKGQEYAYCYLADGFKSSLNGNVATITIDPSVFPRRLKGQNLILTVQAVDAQGNEVYEDVIVRLIEEGTDPTEEKPEGTDPDPGTETNPKNFVTDSEGADYILISPADFVKDWTAYVKARAQAHPELKFAIKNAAEIYEAYGDKGGNPAEMIKSYIAQAAGKGTKYFVLGGAWSDPATIEQSEISFLSEGTDGGKYGQVKLSLANTIPGWYHKYSGKSTPLASDYDYALIDDDKKPDVVVSRIPLVRWPDTTTGVFPTFAEIIRGYGEKVAKVEAADFSGRHRYACAAGQLGSSVSRGSAYWPTEPHRYADGYYDFFDKKHPDSAMDGEIAARRRFRDYFAKYNPVKAGAVVPMGVSVDQFFADQNGWEAIIAKSHGLEGSAYGTGIDDSHFRQTTTLVKFGIFAMPCLTGRPDWVTTWNGFTQCLTPSMGVAAICNPSGGEVVGFHNTHDGAGKNDVALVTTNSDPYATQYETRLLTALYDDRLNAGEAWKAAHARYIDDFGTSDIWHLWTAYESILYGDPLIKLSEIRENEKVKGLGTLPAKVLFK